MDYRRFQGWVGGSNNSRPLMRPYTAFDMSFVACVLKSLFEDIPRDLDASTMANRRQGGAHWRSLRRGRVRLSSLSAGWLHLLLERVLLCRYPDPAEVIRCPSFCRSSWKDIMCCGVTPPRSQR